MWGLTRGLGSSVNHPPPQCRPCGLAPGMENEGHRPIWETGLPSPCFPDRFLGFGHRVKYRKGTSKEQGRHRGPAEWPRSPPPLPWAWARLPSWERAPSAPRKQSPNLPWRCELVAGDLEGKQESWPRLWSCQTTASKARPGRSCPLSTSSPPSPLSSQLLHLTSWSRFCLDF